MIFLDEFNALANMPHIRSAIAPNRQRIDLTHIFNHPDTVIVGSPKGCVTIFWRDGCFEFHWFYQRKFAGKHALQDARQACKTLFTRHPEVVIHGAVPREYRAARALARALGARPQGQMVDTAGRSCIHYTLERALWEQSSEV